MRRGEELYDRIRPQVEEGNCGKIVAIDLETGTFEVAADILGASERFLARCPDAQTWFVRIGYDVLFRIGPRSSGRGMLAGVLRGIRRWTPRRTPKTHFQLGAVSQKLGEDFDALKEYEECERLAKIVRSKFVLAGCLFNKATVLKRQGFLTKAYEAFDKSRDLYRTLGNQSNVTLAEESLDDLRAMMPSLGQGGS